MRHGYWGWGSCFADFNNDGDTDLFHVNGFYFLSTPPRGTESNPFLNDPSRLFLSNGDGTFVERSQAAGIVDTGQGRGVVCFDFDRDGDVDIFVSNNSGKTRLYRNDSPDNSFIHLRLQSTGWTPLGARVTVHTADRRQMQELRPASNFSSQQPAELHFGLAQSGFADALTVLWPTDESETYLDFPARRFETLTRGREPDSMDQWRRVVVLPRADGAARRIVVRNPSDGTVPVSLRFFDFTGGDHAVFLDTGKPGPRQSQAGDRARIEPGIGPGEDVQLNLASIDVPVLAVVSSRVPLEVEVFDAQGQPTGEGEVLTHEAHFEWRPARIGKARPSLLVANPGHLPLLFEIDVATRGGKLLFRLDSEDLGPIAAKAVRSLDLLQLAGERTHGAIVTVRSLDAGWLSARLEPHP